MSRYVFDIETDGLLDELTKVHCLVLKDIDTGEVFSCTDRIPYKHWIKDGLDRLIAAEFICGHNIIGFDIPALQKVYPWFKPRGVIRDTLVMTRLMWPSDVLREGDFKRTKEGKLPGNLIGSFSLAAWGYRLGNYKGDYDGGWTHWSEDMQSYCEQDVAVTADLYARCVALDWPEESVDLEHVVATIVSRQERYGFAFDEVKARALYADLVQRKTELEAELQVAFPPYVKETPFTPKASNSKLGYVKGQPTVKRKTVTFNPSSRDHIASRLKFKHGWEPSEFTNDGKPKVDEEVLSNLPYPEVKLLSEYLMVDKRVGQLSTGNEAWLKHVRMGRIYGRVITNGAVTGRMTHSKPNIAQVPSSKAPWGKRCRELFRAFKGKVLVGCDASALELCCLAGYMARFDDGAYIKTVLEGDKASGTDIHSVNARALGLDPKKEYEIGGQTPPGREIAKTWFYAFIYGAGDFKLGTILGARPGKELATGKKSRRAFMKNLPALGKLAQRVKDRVEGKTSGPKHLVGLDGRRLNCRSSHSALNTLLQSAGAIIMKQALMILDEDLQAAGYVPGEHYEFVANVHDEWQIETDKEIADDVGRRAKAAIQVAGIHFNFACPIDGEYTVGANWSETH